MRPPAKNELDSTSTALLRPSLNLSRLGRRGPPLSQPPSMSCIAAASKPKRIRPSERFDSPPIPSSFVDVPSCRSRLSDNSSGDDERPKPARRKKSNVDKEAIRQQLEDCKSFLAGNAPIAVAHTTIAEPTSRSAFATKTELSSSSSFATMAEPTSCVTYASSIHTSTCTRSAPPAFATEAAYIKSALSSFSGGDDDDDDLLKANPIFTKRKGKATEAALSIAFAAPTIPGPSDPPGVSLSVVQKTAACDGDNGVFSDAGMKATAGMTEAQLIEAVTASYRSSHSASTDEVFAAVRTRLGLPHMGIEQKTAIRHHLDLLKAESKPKARQLKTDASSAPDTPYLLSVVDEIFASMAARAGALQDCTVKQFLLAAQAKFSAPFSKESKTKVKERVTLLMTNYSRLTTRDVSGRESKRPSSDEMKKKITSILKYPAATQVSISFATRPLVQLSDQTGDEAEGEQPVGPIAEEISFESAQTLKANANAFFDLDIPAWPKDRRTRLPKPEIIGKTKDGASELSGGTGRQKVETVDSIDSFPLEESVQAVAVATKPKHTRLQGGCRGKRPARVAVSSTIADEDAAILKPPVAAKSRERKRRRSMCTQCSKCPCQYKFGEPMDSSTGLDFAKSDAAVEKALIKRLLKLEATTDQYEEQTNAVQRRLKKHRRDMWKKREDLLGACDDLVAKRRGNQTSSRFIADVNECELLGENEGNRNRLRQSIAKAQLNVFAVKATVQPTLTQMMGSNKEKPGNSASLSATPTREDRAAQTAEFSGEASDSDSSHRSDDEPSSGKASSCEVPVTAYRVDSRDTLASCTESGVLGTTERFGIWEALRNGHYECSWDRLFFEKTDDLAVDLLLGLLEDTTQASPEDAACLSQSSLSIRGRLLADSVTDEILSNAEKLAAVDILCPNWRENIVFSMGQTNKTDISDAMTNVRECQAKLQRAKIEFLENIERHEVVLGVFEETLQQSLTRFTIQQELPGLEGCFMSQGRAAPSPSCTAGKSRQSMECETGTIITSPCTLTRTVKRTYGFGVPCRNRAIVTTAGNTLSPGAIVPFSAQCRPGAMPDTPLSLASRDSLMASP